MNAKEELNALTGGNADKPAPEVDWEARYRELESKVENDRLSNKGRWDKVNAENAELRQKLSEAMAHRSEDDALSALSEDERAALPDEVLSALGKVAAGAKADAERRMMEIESERRAEAEARRESATGEFLARIDREFPGVRASIMTGGVNRDAWMSYYGPNKQTIDYALSSGDFDTFAYHLRQFYSYHLGSDIPSGTGSSAAEPPPMACGNGPASGMNANRRYTAQEYQQLEERAMKLRQSGRLEEYRKLSDELDNILAEGRVSD